MAIDWGSSLRNVVSFLLLIRGNVDIDWRVGVPWKDFQWYPGHLIAIERNRYVRHWHLWWREVGRRGCLGRCLTHQWSSHNPGVYMCSVLSGNVSNPPQIEKEHAIQKAIPTGWKDCVWAQYTNRSGKSHTDHIIWTQEAESRRNWLELWHNKRI
jgi:hypothetical protein